jgi:hypothetical protein
VLDRRTGKSLFPVTEKPVPQGGAEPADRLSKTQSFSGYANLREPDLTEADMWGMTPLDQLWCRIQFRRADYRGTYTPPTDKRHFIEYPSYNGGSDWGGLAVDQKDGIVVANYNDMANYTELISRAEADKLHILPIDGPHPKSEGGIRRAGRRALWRSRQSRLAGVDRADVQAAALWPHPRLRPQDWQDTLGRALWPRHAERAVPHPARATARNRDAEQWRQCHYRWRPNLHLRGDRRPDPGHRHQDRQDAVERQAAGGWAGDAYDL